MSDHDNDRAFLKGLFSQQVDAVGTHEAAAVFLGISRQRVGQLISTSCQDMPTLMQVWKLQKVTRQSLVFAPLGRLNEDDDREAEALASAIESTATASRALQAVHTARADGVLEDDEIETARDAARENLAAAQRQFDDTMRLRPTLRAVA